MTSTPAGSPPKSGRHTLYLQVLAGIITPSEGEVAVDGHVSVSRWMLNTIFEVERENA